MKKKNTEDVTTGYMSADYQSQLYDKVPCTVGQTYMRVEVDGGVLPCCIAQNHVTEIDDKNFFFSGWMSGSYDLFRKKMKLINKTRFHRNDPEWAFCNQCPHADINIKNYKDYVDQEKS